MRALPNYILTLSLSGLAVPAVAFENTKVLPKGVRNVLIKNVNTTLHDRTDSDGAIEPLAYKLNEDLTFTKVINGKKGLNRTKLQGWLQLRPEFDNDTVLGRYTADLKGHVQVTAPLVSYGLTEKLTVAIAVPYYRAATDIQVGFTQTPHAQSFINALTDRTFNLYASAEEAHDKLSNGVRALNDKLIENGYAALETWGDHGLGDITLAAKYRVLSSAPLSASATLGSVLPTGRTDDPDILTDIPFGDGNLDLFTTLAMDEQLLPGLFANQYFKYTYQAPGRRTIRLQTDAESIEVGKSEATFKLGDKYETGLSLQFEPTWGLVSGIGYVFEKKYGDSYNFGTAQATRRYLEQQTDQQGQFAEIRLGYSTIPAFQRGEIPVPVSATFEFRKHLASRHLPIRDLATFDLSLFF